MLINIVFISGISGPIDSCHAPSNAWISSIQGYFIFKIHSFQLAIIMKAISEIPFGFIHFVHDPKRALKALDSNYKSLLLSIFSFV